MSTKPTTEHKRTVLSEHIFNMSGDTPKRSVAFAEGDGPTDRHKSIVDRYGQGATGYGSLASAYRRRSVVNSIPAAPEGTLVMKDRHFSSVAENNADFNEMSTEAEDQAEKTSNIGLWKGLQTYPQAAAWSVLLASTIIMEGYDTSLIGSLFAYNQFAEECGGTFIDGKYQIAAAWQTGLQNGEFLQLTSFSIANRI